MVLQGINIPERELAAYCQQNHINKLALFGSVLRRDFRPGSDIDVLVEIEPGHGVGLIRFARMERELSELIGHDVDLNTEGFISPYFREQVLKEARTVYVAT